MKMTRKMREELAYILRNLERGQNYIMSNNVAIARRSEHATTTLHYTRADGQCLYEIEKSYGSDLTGITTGIQALKNFLLKDEAK